MSRVTALVVFVLRQVKVYAFQILRYNLLLFYFVILAEIAICFMKQLLMQLYCGLHFYLHIIKKQY